MKPVTVVIPVVEYHDEFLPELFSSLSYDNQVLEAVIIARSGLNCSLQAEYKNWLIKIAKDAGLDSDLTLSAVHETAREAPNRNRGWSLVKTPYTAFLDADDAYSSGRLTLLQEVANRTKASLLLHDYSLNKGDILDATTVAIPELMGKLIQAEEIRLATFGDSLFPFPWESTKGKGQTSLKLPDEFGSVGVCHGHSFVLTVLREEVAFRDIYPGSDGVFCQEILAQQTNVYVVPMKLSAWIIQRSAYRNSRPRFLKALSKAKSTLKSFPRA
jgi:hypothetical protein